MNLSPLPLRGLGSPLNVVIPPSPMAWLNNLSPINSAVKDLNHQYSARMPVLSPFQTRVPVFQNRLTVLSPGGAAPEKPVPFEQPQGLSAAPGQPPLYECQYGCGYEDPECELVEAHELNCFLQQQAGSHNGKRGLASRQA
jgi:hypothetical protein